MATSNARIQFSTADEKTWKDINPILREGELVITKKPSGKYRLYVGGTGGSKFNDSILVWDEEEAENLANKAASNANLAEDHATSAGMSANAAMSSKSAAAASASYAAQSKEAAKASADTAKQSMETAKTNAINAAQNSASALQSSNEAKQSMNTAKENADTAKTAAANAINSASSAAESEAKANVSKNAAEKSASAAKISETNARSSEQAAAASAATVSYATQEEVNAGIENKKIVSPATLAPLVHIIQRKAAYKVGDCLHVPGRNDIYLECITAGTTAATAPANLSTVSAGVTINDGTAEFKVINKSQKALIDLLYPVGIIITTGTDTAKKPGETEGLAAWEEIAQNRVLQGCTNGAGGTFEAGLPNITGYITTGDGNSGVTSVFGSGGKHSGALYVDEDKNFSNDAYAAPAGTGNNAFGFSFDASKSNNIYGNSSTVQPPAYKVHFWKRIK